VLVAITYHFLNAEGFQKSYDFQNPGIMHVLLAPYWMAAWLNSRLFTWREPWAVEIIPGVWMGATRFIRYLSQFYVSVLDLTATSPPVGYAKTLHYIKHSVPRSSY